MRYTIVGCGQEPALHVRLRLHTPAVSVVRSYAKNSILSIASVITEHTTYEISLT